MKNLIDVFASFLIWMVKAIKLGVVVIAVSGAAAFLAAPSFFGVVMLTSGAIATVLMYGFIAFCVGLIFNVPKEWQLSHLWDRMVNRAKEYYAEKRKKKAEEVAQERPAKGSATKTKAA